MIVIETHLRSLIRNLLLEQKQFATYSSIAKNVSAASKGMYKPGTGRGGGHVRLSVLGDPEAAKNLSQTDKQAILKRAGYDVVRHLPAAQNPYSGSFEGFEIRPAGDTSSTPITVVFAGAEKLGAEKTAIDGIQAQLDLLKKTENDVYAISIDPNSEFEELRRPRFVKSIEKVGGTPKADAIMPGYRASDTIFISLKGGTKAKHHQQWSGFTQFSDYSPIRDFAATVVGVSDVQNGKIQLPQGPNAALPFHSKLENEDGSDSPDEYELKVMSVYGPNAFPVTADNFGKDKVHVVLQSPVPEVMKLSKAQAATLYEEFYFPEEVPLYTLVGAHKVSYPEIPEGDYAPYMHARYDSSSKLQIGQFLDNKTMKNFGLDPGESTKGVRFLIFPKDKLPRPSKDVEQYEIDQTPWPEQESKTFGEASLRKYLKRIIREALDSDSRSVPTHVLSAHGRKYDIKVASVNEIKKHVSHIRRQRYKPDVNEVWVASDPGGQVQAQADYLFSLMTGGFPGGPVQFYWDPTQNSLFVHVRYNTF